MKKTRQQFKSRIKESPETENWHNDVGGFNDGWTTYGKYNFDGLSDAEKVELIVFAWNDIDLLPTSKAIAKTLEIEVKKVRKLIKSARENELIKNTPAFSEDTGLLCGSGYELNKNFKQLHYFN